MHGDGSPAPRLRGLSWPLGKINVTFSPLSNELLLPILAPLLAKTSYVCYLVLHHITLLHALLASSASSPAATMAQPNWTPTRQEDWQPSDWTYQRNENGFGMSHDVPPGQEVRA